MMMGEKLAGETKLVTAVQEACGDDATKQSATSQKQNLGPDAAVGCPSDLEEEFTCAICFELIVMPTTLNCGHSFCRHCLALWCEAGKKTECPSCREKFAGLPLENIQIKSSLQKLFPEKYEIRRQFLQDNEEATKAIKEFDGVLKKQRDDEEITAASCGFFIGVCISVVVVSCLYMVLGPPSHYALWENVPMESWTTGDVSSWLEDLGLHSYKAVFADLDVDGHHLSAITLTDLAPMFYMHNPVHQEKLMEAIERAKLRSHTPTNLWEFKAMHEGYTSFLLFSFDRTPRLALLYLYKYDRTNYDFYKRTVLSCNSNSTSDDESWWFHAGYFISPQLMNLMFVSCFGSLHYWISRILLVQCVCKALLDFIALGKSFSNPQNVTFLKLFGPPLFMVAVVYVISYVWWLLPTFITDVLFYAELFLAPIYNLKLLFGQLFHG